MDSTKALKEAMRRAMDIYQADDERDVGEAMFMVLHAALSAQGEAAQPAAEDWVLVPREPTAEMRVAGWDLARITVDDIDDTASHVSPNVLAIWEAMIAASPNAAPQDGARE